MKIVSLILILCFLLAGCGTEPMMETVEDLQVVEPVAKAQQLYVKLPAEAAAPTFQDEHGGELYLCQGFTLTKQVVESGDLSKTVKNVTGQEKEQLQILKTMQEGAERYDFVWAAAGEDGLQVGRACVLDDGNYHYVLSTMAGEAESGELKATWQELFDSCCLISSDIDINTGS